MTESLHLHSRGQPGRDAAGVDTLLRHATALEQQDRLRARQTAEEALALALQLGDDGRAAHAGLQLATLEWRLSDLGSAARHAGDALARFREQRDRANEAWSLRLLGNIHGVQSQYVPASEYLLAAAALSRECGNQACLASCLNNLGIIANELGDYAASLEYLLEALDLSPPRDPQVPSTLNNIATLYRQLDQGERALVYHGQALELARTAPIHPLLASLVHNMAESYRTLDRAAEALPLLHEALILARQAMDRQTEMLTLDSLGQTYHLLGQTPLAQECYQEGLGIAAQVRHPLAEVKLLTHQAALTATGRREMLERALRLATETDLRAEQREIHDLLVGLHRDAGEVAEALAQQDQARALERALYNEAQDRRTQVLQIQHDLHRTRELAEAQQALNLQLARANEELEAFSYSLSHDLKTPVRHISGFTSMLRRALASGKTADAGRFLDIIEEATGRMNTMIDVLLQSAQHATAPLRPTAVDLGELVEVVQQDLATELHGRDVSWQVGQLPVVQGDRELLRLVLLNLLSNALKYSQHRAQAVIELHAEQQDAEWVIQIRDNGAGFDPRWAGRLFGAFQRLHRPEEFEGSGVGLATVKRIIARHGGRVWAESQPDQGATFFFALPLGQPNLP